MKIKKIIWDNTEPQDCVGCKDDWIGLNYVWLEISNELTLHLNLCGDCLIKLKSALI